MKCVLPLASPCQIDRYKDGGVVQSRMNAYHGHRAGAHRRILRIALALLITLGLLPLLTPQFAAASTGPGEVRLRAVHAVPDLAGTPVDVYANGAKVLTFDFFTVSDYLTVPAGTYLLQVVPAGGNPATDAAISAEVTLAAGEDYSAIAHGTLDPSDHAPLGLLLYGDFNQLPAAGTGHVRVLHFSPNAPAVDIIVNGTRVIRDLTFLNSSPYLPLPVGTYTVGVAPAGGEPIFTTELTVGDGQIATAWANGLLGASGPQAFTVTPSIDVAGTP